MIYTQQQIISADEAMFAGIPNWNSSNSNNYLYTGQYYWTMSPYYFDSTNGRAYVFVVRDYGYLVGWDVDDTSGVRPVINIRADVALSGSGTTSDPFKVVGAS